MSQENVELAYRGFDALAQRDRDTFVALHDPDVEIHPLIEAIGGTYRGHDGARQWWNDIFSAFPDFSARLDQVRDLGDWTLGAAHISAHGAHGMDSTGSMVEQVNWVLAEMRDERIVSWRTYRSEAEALDAVNVMKKGPPR